MDILGERFSRGPKVEATLFIGDDNCVSAYDRLVRLCTRKEMSFDDPTECVKHAEEDWR